MDRREIIARLAKATTTTTVAAGGLMSPSQSKAFLEEVMEQSSFGTIIRQEIVPTVDGEINKLSTGRRIIRAAAENSDDGYRVEPTFPDVPFATKKWRLPFEVTDDTYEQNIEKAQLEATLVRRFAAQAGDDLDDLNINGDEAAGAGPDQSFLQIDNGLLKLLATVAGVHRVNGGAINGGVISKAHFFAAKRALPNKYRQAGNLQWLASPGTVTDWQEYLTDRATAAGDSAIGAADGAALKPLGIPFAGGDGVSFMPDDRLVLANPKHFVRALFGQVKRYFVHPGSDWELATRDKHGYIFFGRQDFIIDEPDAVVDVYGLV